MPDEKRLRCEYCAHSVGSSMELNKHCWNKHREIAKRDWLPCQFCSEYFRTKLSMSIHVARLHKKENPKHDRQHYFFCKFCKTDIKKTESVKSISSHANIKHLGIISKIWMLCEICGQYLMSGAMSTHIKLHHSRMRKCDFCPKNYPYSISLTHSNKRHLEEVSKIWLKCDQCDFYLPTSEDLQNHQHVQKSRNLQLKCSFCRELFTNKNVLSRHLKKHKEAAKCSKCHARFLSVEDKSGHKCREIYHEQLCEFCPKVCREGKTYFQHANSAHRDQISEIWFPCQICQNYFPSNLELSQHTCIKCEFCLDLKTFNAQSYYIDHAARCLFN